MKHKGSFSEYENQRNKELASAYRQLLHSASFISMPDIYAQLVLQPCSRLWVSEERAAIVVSSMMRGFSIQHMTPNKQAMYRELLRRVTLLQRNNPHASIYELAFTAVHQPATQFYLTPGSAKVIIHKIKTQWYEKRKRKLRHLF